MNWDRPKDKAPSYSLSGDRVSFGERLAAQPLDLELARAAVAERDNVVDAEFVVVAEWPWPASVFAPRSCPKLLQGSQQLDVYRRAIEFLSLATLMLEEMPRGYSTIADQFSSRFDFGSAQHRRSAGSVSAIHPPGRSAGAQDLSTGAARSKRGRPYFFGETDRASLSSRDPAAFDSVNSESQSLGGWPESSILAKVPYASDLLS